MARDKGLLSDLQIRHWIRAGTPLAKADGNGLTLHFRPLAWPAGFFAIGTVGGDES